MGFGQTQTEQLQEAKREELASQVNQNIPEQKKVVVIAVAAQKGHGKTYSALSLINENDSVLAISFDGKTQAIKDKDFENMKVEVYNTEKFIRWTAERTQFGLEPLESVENTFKNCQLILEKLSDMKDSSVDYVIVDGLNLAERYAESYMRFKHGLKYSDTFKNWNYWKERNSWMNFMLSSSIRKARKGVIYTLYMTENIKKREDGEITESEEVPKYAEDIMFLSDLVIKIEKKDEKGKGTENIRTYTALIDSSKLKGVISGTKFNVTEKKLNEFVKL